MYKCGNSHILETNDLLLMGFRFDPTGKPHNSCVVDICVRMFWGDDDFALRTYSYSCGYSYRVT